MRFHWQNLNEKPTGLGSGLRHGRAWFYNKGHRQIAHCEWHFFTHFCRVSFNLGNRGDEDELSFSLGCPLLVVFFSVKPGKFHGWLLDFFKIPNYEDRKLSFSIHDGSLYWNLWTQSMEWSKARDGRRQGSFDPIDFIFGRPKYSETPISKHEVEIPMPECAYPAIIEMQEARWKRPRWPLVWRRLLRADITPLTPIPFPGKGENSWDCGEDACHGMTCGAKTVDEAIGKMVSSVMRDRRRYGGEKWRPEAKSTQGV